jgi:hypothetical protein
MTGIMQMFVGGGGKVVYPWESWQTGDSQLGGVVVRYSNKIGVRWFPQSRVTLGFANNMSSLSTTQTIPAGVSSVDIFCVGGGAGGTGANSCAGGGGGFVSATGVVVSGGTTSVNIQAGRGGKGGVLTGSMAASNYVGNYPDDAGGQSGAASFVTISGAIDIAANGGTAGATSVSNTTNASELGQGGTGVVNSNPAGYTTSTGTGGRGGGRNFAPTAGTNGGAGAGGGNTSDNPDGYDNGSAGSGRFGGGGGGGNAPTSSWTVNSRPGGAGGTEAYAGGYGGSVTDGNPQFGQNGLGDTYWNAGGRAYTASDGNSISPISTNLVRGSSGGGGFPGGGGGSSWYGGTPNTGDLGFGSDGASGMVQIEWALP